MTNATFLNRWNRSGLMSRKIAHNLCFATDMLLLRSKEDSWTDVPLHVAPMEQRIISVSCFATDMLLLRSKEDSWTDVSIHIAPTEQRNLRGRFIATDMLLPTDMLLLTEQRGFVDGRFNTYCSYGARKIHGVILCYRHVAPNGAKRIRGRTFHYMLLLRSKEIYVGDLLLPTCCS